MKIIPAILAKTLAEFQGAIKKIEPYTDLVHLDIADGEFVPNRTIEGYEEMGGIDTKLNFEIHLMINNPESVIDRWLKTKAMRYLIHPESTGDIESLMNQIKGSGREIGLVLNPETDYSAVEPYLDPVRSSRASGPEGTRDSVASATSNGIDLVQFMTVDPGFQGSLFLPEVLEKIRNFHGRYPDKIIQVDGGIRPEIVKLAEAAGASRAAVGSYIFQNNNVEKVLKELNV